MTTEKITNNNIYVLYHDHCQDGFAAAFVAWLFFEQKKWKAEFIPVSYGKPMPEIADGSKVYIVDFSYTADEIKALSQRMEMVVVLDHHATAKEELAIEKFPNSQLMKEGFFISEDNKSLIWFDLEKCGAMLAWKFWFPRLPVPALIEYVQDRDLWKFKLMASKQVQAYLKSWPQDFPVWSANSGLAVRFLNEHHIKATAARCNAWAEQGKLLLSLQDQNIKRILTNRNMAIFTFHHGEGFINRFIDAEPSGEGEPLWYKVPIINSPIYQSELCHDLLGMHPDAKFACAYWDTEDSKQQWSLRSRTDFDCSDIAKMFGGGGHPNAAGFVIDEKRVSEELSGYVEALVHARTARSRDVGERDVEIKKLKALLSPKPKEEPTPSI